MKGEVDLRLVEFLKGSLGFSDALRDIGIKAAATVRVGRDEGLRLLELVAGASDAEAEAWSQRGRNALSGWNDLKVANIVFQWPRAVLLTERAANDNDSTLHGVEWFIAEVPAMR